MSKYLTLIIFPLIIIFGYLIYQNFMKGGVIQTEVGELIKSPSPTTVYVSTPTETPENGFIEGSLSYPSEEIPSDIEICAETIYFKEIKCTKEHIQDEKYTYGLGYKLEVPEGKYYIYATSRSFNQRYKAYYDEFVKCGLSIDCHSHKPIAVEVKKNETSNNINPWDWYYTVTPF